MAIQTASLSSVEHDWFATRSGIVGNAPLNDHKRAYFSLRGITGQSKPISQMEREWLATLPGVTGTEIPDMWVQAVASINITPSSSMNENKFKFYSSVIYQDSFNVLSNQYTVGNGTWSVTGGELNCTASSGGTWADRVIITNQTFTDFEMYAKVKKPADNTMVVFRSSTTNGSGYGVQLRDTNTFRLERWGVASIASATNITWSTGQYYSVRVRCVGTSIKAKVWVFGTSEPSTWDIDTTDSNYSSGSIGFSGESVVTTEVFDNLIALSI